MPIRLLFDPRRTARLLLAAVTATAVLLAPQAAAAETRIVSLKSSIKDVTVDSVKSGNRTLKEVGRGSGILFVEAGRESVPFACEQALTISLSDGRSLSKTYDLCAINYVVDVGATDLAAKRETATRIERKLVMIQTDDDTAIRDVAIDGTAMKVRRRSKARVFVEVDGDPRNGGQIACRRNLRLVLADGRILQDEVDICGDWKVTVNTKAALARGSAGGVRQAVPSGSGPSAPPLAGGVRRPDTSLRGSTEESPSRSRDTAAEARNPSQTPAGPSETADTSPAQAPEDAVDTAVVPVFENRTWYVEREGGDSLSLIYGRRETDDRGFLASCRPGSGEIDFDAANGGRRAHAGRHDLRDAPPATKRAATPPAGPPPTPERRNPTLWSR
ncbi:MAG: hypothetical protein HPM95_13915 [Alphaproteobacteria bacterium]|nr:hypothetical protein [Alphaproteobacteria bacterium]